LTEFEPEIPHAFVAKISDRTEKGVATGGGEGSRASGGLMFLAA
jgi:hypothetical protein